MNTPFKIKFRRNVANVPDEVIIKNFRQRFKDTYCDEIISIGTSRIVVKNDVFWWPRPDLNWNIWLGIPKAEIIVNTPQKGIGKTVDYIVDFTRMALAYISWLLLILISFCSVIAKQGFHFIYLFVFLAFTFIFTGLISISLLRQRALFLSTLREENIYLGNYNWTEILTNKSDRELKYIASGKSHLTSDVANLAKKELEKRQNRSL